MPTLNTAEFKAYEEKIKSQLEQAKKKLYELEGYFKGKKAELEVAHGLMTTHREIERKANELKTAAESKVTVIKAEIDSTLAGFNTRLAELASKAHQKVG
jgi:hypothetical protein